MTAGPTTMSRKANENRMNVLSNIDANRATSGFRMQARASPLANASTTATIAGISIKAMGISKRFVAASVIRG